MTLRVHARADMGAGECRYGFTCGPLLGFKLAGCYGFGIMSIISPGN